MQLLFDTFGLHSNIWDYTGGALPKGIKFYLQTLWRHVWGVNWMCRPSFFTLTLVVSFTPGLLYSCGKVWPTARQLGDWVSPRTRGTFFLLARMLNKNNSLIIFLIFKYAGSYTINFIFAGL